MTGVWPQLGLYHCCPAGELQGRAALCNSACRHFFRWKELTPRSETAPSRGLLWEPRFPGERPHSIGPKLFTFEFMFRCNAVLIFQRNAGDTREKHSDQAGWTLLPGLMFAAWPRTAASLILTAPGVASGGEGTATKNSEQSIKFPLVWKQKHVPESWAVCSGAEEGEPGADRLRPHRSLRGNQIRGRSAQRETSGDPGRQGQEHSVSYSHVYCESPAVCNPGRCVCLVWAGQTPPWVSKLGLSLLEQSRLI